MSGNLYQFLYICFTLAPVPRIFTKLFKIPVAVLRGLKIKSIVYLDDVWSKEILMASNKVIIYIIFFTFPNKMFTLHTICTLQVTCCCSHQLTIYCYYVYYYILYNISIYLLLRFRELERRKHNKQDFNNT